MTSKSQNTILVAMDFSPHSQNAADLASHLAQAHSALVVFVYVIDFPTRFFQAIPQDEFEEKMLNKAAKELKYLIQEFEEMGLETGYEIIRGRPFAGILAAVRHYQPRFLLMGLRGQQQPFETFVGGNTLRVIRHANCPVIVVRDLKAFESLDQLLVIVQAGRGIERIQQFLSEFSGVLAKTVNLLAPIDPERHDPQVVMRLLEKEGDRLQKAGYKQVICTVVEDSMTTTSILNFLGDNLDQLDMVLIESSLTGTLSNIGQGSVVEDLLKLSPIPVMVSSPEMHSDEEWVREGDFLK